MKKSILKKLEELRPDDADVSFPAWLIEHNYNFFRDRLITDAFCCTKCMASGKIRDPNQQADPVEGWKLVDKIDCPDCDGSGLLSLSKGEEVFESERIDDEEKLADWKKDKETVDGILSVLDDDQLKVLARYML